MVVFPPDGATRRAGGLVRQRYLLIELESGAVYHLSAPYNWGPLPDRVATLSIGAGWRTQGRIRAQEQRVLRRAIFVLAQAAGMRQGQDPPGKGPGV